MNHFFRRRAALIALGIAALTAARPASADPSAWKNPQPPQPAVLIVRNATVWTGGPAGVLESADLLIRRGRIEAVGRGLAVPAGAEVVDAGGKHVTAGMIDAHSHTAITGGVNEGTNITTAEVRVADVIDAEDIDIYRQLAGGTTAANLLHGSANSIGGQNAVIKLRWGGTPEQLLFAGAPSGIKFALGENPKRANWGPPGKRFPNTRQGVEHSIRERFQAARDYRREWTAHRQDRGGNQVARVAPRKDLQLEALLEILDGKRLVHAHSYRADEILMMIRLAEEFGFRVASFQHVLEGYKVAAEIARHGAHASGFSDWWAYKFEVVDAIPYNAAILHHQGALASFNSDSSELARRLNLEAAKAVRYGGVPEAEALNFVTLNPAKLLGIADRVGSLEPGKDADFVIWSGHPLSTYSVCEQTWVDGRKYFDLAADRAARPALEAERAALFAKVAEAGKKAKPDEKKEDEPAQEPTEAIR